MQQLNNARAGLDFGVEVWPLLSWATRFEFARLAGLYQAATDGTPEEYGALAAMADRFIAEAQPTWDFADHHGIIPTTGKGFLRLPPKVQWPLINGWLDTFDAAQTEPEREAIEGLHLVESDAPTAADAVLPPGPLQREVKRRLKAARKAA